MIELPIPAEITKYEAKLVGPFTTRQAICGAGALVLGFGIWNVFRNTVSSQVLYTVIICCAIPFALFGWWKPFGMHAEQFVMAVLFNTIISPTKRYFKTSDYITPAETRHDEYALPANASRREIKTMQRRKRSDDRRKQNAMKKYKKLMLT